MPTIRQLQRQRTFWGIASVVSMALVWCILGGG